MKSSRSWTLRSNEGMPGLLRFIIVFRGHCGTLALPTLFGSPYCGIFLLSLSVTGISLAFVQICFLSSILAASCFYSLVHVFLLVLFAMCLRINISLHCHGALIRIFTMNYR
jgi:hypothetical protein